MKYDPYRLAHFVAMTLISQGIVVAVIGCVLFYTEFGEEVSGSMPDGVRIALLAITYVAVNWLAISRRPRR